MRLIPTCLLAAHLVGCSAGPRFGPARTVAAKDAENPTIAADPRSGAVYVAWVQTDPDSSSNAYLSALGPDGTPGPPVRLNQRSDRVAIATQNPAQVVVTADGAVIVGWVSDHATHGSPRNDISIRLVRSTDGGRTFSAPTSVAIDQRRWPANLYYDLAAGSDTALYVSWLDLHYYTDSLAAHAAAHLPDSIPVPESRVDFRVARSTDGGRSFVGPAILDTSSCICCRTAIAVGRDGAVHALWRHVFPGNVRDFVSATSTDNGASFTTPHRVHEDHWVLNGCPDIGPDLAVDAENVLHAIWYTGAPGRQGLWYATSADGGQTFTSPMPVLTDQRLPPSEAKLATLGGSTWVTWEDRRRRPGEILLARAGSTEGIRVGFGEYPAVAAGAGRLAVAWADQGTIRVRTARLR
jgi:hypothetical protein